MRYIIDIIKKTKGVKIMAKYKNGDIVKYKVGSLISGVGKIVGQSTSWAPGIGTMWIIEDIGSTLPIEGYEFKCFCCPEVCIEPKDNS